MYCVVMAGGSGTRFWPKSRENRSKQFLRMFGKDSLIQSTLKRFSKIVGWDYIYIVAKSNQKELIQKQIRKVPEDNIIFEPVGKNTAACIGLSAVYIGMNAPDDVIIISPADHLVKKESQFCNVIKAAAQLAEDKDALVTIGIRPTRPSTGYGYIQINEEKQTLHQVDTYRVKTFAEKPNYETARRFLESGDFFWNSGIFVFKVSVILKAIEEFMPDLYDTLMEIRNAIGKKDFPALLDRAYHQIKNTSIDYGVMERARNVFMVKGEFEWNDLGSWDQVYKLSSQDSQANATLGNTVLIDTKNSYIASNDGVVAVLGMEDVVVVRDGDAVLVCKRNRSEDVRYIVDRLKREKLKKYL
ncbi:mannose-1-phosphate guanylyltransferase [bacterium]|nr:mannose-1-phosphate guanylyltransferase [bacterium]